MFFHRGLDDPRICLSPDEPTGGGKEVQDLKEKIEYLDKELKTVISQRDEAKKDKAEALGKIQEIEDKKKIESGEFQKLADERQKIIDTQKVELDRLKTVETEHNLFIENRKKVLIEQIPEDKRPEWDKSDLATLEKVVPLFNLGGDKTLSTDNGMSGKQLDTRNKKWDDFSLPELDEIEKSNKVEFERLHREKYGK